MRRLRWFRDTGDPERCERYVAYGPSCAQVHREGPHDKWRAMVCGKDTNETDENDIIRDFWRRCDAKRWCERMLAEGRVSGDHFSPTFMVAVGFDAANLARGARSRSRRRERRGLRRPAVR